MNIDDLVLNPSDRLFYKKFTDVPFTGEVSGEESGSFKNGKRTGLWKYYFETGLLSERGYYKEGRRDRFWESFDPQGWLLQTLNYKNDYVTGEFRSFHSFGQVKEKGNYKEGKQEGLWEYFNKNDTLERTETPNRTSPV